MKFGIDRRRTSLSAEVREGKISRSEALNILEKRPKTDNETELLDYILEKIDLPKEDFEKIMTSDNKNFKNYKTYYNYLKFFKFVAKICYKINLIPKILYLKYFGTKY